MPFTSVLASSCLTINFDKDCGHLFVRLASQDGLPAFNKLNLSMPPNSGKCLIQDNLPTLIKDSEVLTWLTKQLTPALLAADILHWAWVCGPTLRSHHLAEQLALVLPQVQFTVFGDLEHAATWLQQQPLLA